MRRDGLPAVTTPDGDERASLTTSALRGVSWNYAGSAVLMVTQIAATATTARLIDPAGFGAYAVAQAAVGILGYFTFTTIGVDVCRRAQLGPKTVGSALTLAVVSGGTILLALLFLAGPWAAAWNVPSSANLVRVLALTLFFNSLAGVPLALARRHLRFGVVAIAETATQVGGTALSVGLAVMLHSALALAIGQASAAAGLFLASVVISRSYITLNVSRTEVRTLLTFASQLSFLYFGTYVLNTAPAWVIARSFGANTLGLYSRASLIVGLPLTYLSSGVTKVLFPLYGRVRDDIDRTRALLSEGIALLTGFTWPLLGVIAGGSSVVVDVLLGPRWHGAGPLLQLCALAACANLPSGMLTTAAEALGWMRIAAAREAIFLIMIALSLSGAEWGHFGLKELLLAVAISQWVTYLLILRPFLRREILDVRLVVQSNVAHGAAALAAYSVALGCSRLLDGTPQAVQVIGQLVVAGIVVTIVLRGQSWFPASQVLSRRLGHAYQGNDSGFVVRLRAAVLR